MLSTKYLLSALAVFGLAAAQSSTSLCAQATATISSQSDASALAGSCTTLSGSLSIASSVAGTLDLGGIQQIKGDLSVVGAVNLTQLNAAQLNSIGGSFTLTSLTILNTIGMGSLTSVGNIAFTTLNALQTFSFTKQITKANNMLVTDCALTDLAGINLATVGQLEISNNNMLRSWTAQLANVTGGMIISGNNPALNVSFPNLIWANNMTVINVTDIQTPSLSVVNGTFGVHNSYMSSIVLANLTKVGADFAIVADASLTNISAPLLGSVGGGLLIANNSHLLNITGFPALKTIGAGSVSGNYTDFELPSLTNCAGGFNAQSSGNFSCSPFQSYKTGGTIKGTFTCQATSNNVQASGVTGSNTASATSGSPSSTGTKSAASMPIPEPEMFGLSALLGGLAFLLF